MEAFFKNVLDYFLNYISQYSYFISWDYYGALFSKYFSVYGFSVGIFFVLLVYCSSAEEQKKAGFFKVLPIIALINSCAVLSNFINSHLSQGFPYNGMESMINAPDNIISGFVLTLVVSSCYSRLGGRAFLFGVATHIALPLMNFALFENISDGVLAFQMVIRVALVGFVCLIMSYRKHFFTSWIWYFVFHMSIRIAVFLILLLIDRSGETSMYTVEYSISGAVEYFSNFIFDTIIFAVILSFAIVFEKGVLTIRPIKQTT